MIDFTEIPEDGELWEMFARDFLVEAGFYIESSPDRGPDGKKDLLVTEQLKGALGKYELRWLVSCKHFAKSNQSVKESHEPNVRERLEGFNADGFIGFYSTLPSSGLNGRLNQLRSNGKIKDYKIFDKKLIENYLIRIGYSKLLLQYFPRSYQIVQPISLLLDDYIPLTCNYCGRDLLKLFYEQEETGNLVFAIEFEDGIRNVKKVYWACRGDCDYRLRDDYYRNYDLITGWLDLRDLAIPTFFLKSILGWMESIRAGQSVFTEEAFDQLEDFIVAMFQKVCREMTAKELERAKEVIDISRGPGFL